MKNMIVVFLSVIVLVVAAAPFGVGFFAEARLQALLDDINKENVVDFTIIKVDRGWFASEAIIEAELSVCIAKNMGKVTTLSGSNVNGPKLALKSTIYHGPFPLIGGSFSPVPVVALIDSKFINGVGDEESFINIDYSFAVELGLSGDSHIDLSIPEWEGALGEDETVSWQGLNAKIFFAEGLKKARVEASAPYLRLDAKNGIFLLEGVNLSSDTRKGVEGISLGSGQFDIGKIEITDSATSTNLKLGKASFAADTTAAGDSLNSHIEFRMEKLAVSGQEYGQALLSMDLRNLNAGAVSRIQKQLDEIRCQTDAPVAQSSSLMQGVLLAELGNLLRQAPEFEISELSLDSVFGKTITTARVSVDGSKPELLGNPLTALGAIAAEIDVEIPEGLLVAFSVAALRDEFKDTKTEEQIQQMAKTQVDAMMSTVASQFFVKTGGVYKFSAGYKDGVPMLNGEPFQIPF